MSACAVAWVTLAMLATGCGRPAAVTWTAYRDTQSGFTILVPSGWQRTSSGGAGVRFLPPDATAGSAEFISIFTLPSRTGASETELRRQVFSLLPIHGVSGFQQDARTTPQVLWFKFEVTGSTGTAEWASVGVAVGGRAKIAIAICAKPLPKWRGGQAQCDQVMRSFQPGDLSRE